MELKVSHALFKSKAESYNIQVMLLKVVNSILQSEAVNSSTQAMTVLAGKLPVLFRSWLILVD